MEIYAEAVVILDTNQWDRMPMLRHRLAASLLSALRRNDMVLLLPDLVRHEVELHLTEKYESAQKKVSQGLGEIRQLLGESIDIPSVDARVIRTAFQERIDELNDLVEEIRTEDSDRIQAGRMVLAMEPPNSRTSQQYKDSLLWRLVVRAATHTQVYFVSEDLAFYTKSGGEFASNLRSEAEKSEFPITPFRKVEDLLEQLQPGELEALDPGVVEDFQLQVKHQLDGLVLDYGPFEVGNPESFDTSRFLTDNPDSFSLSSNFSFELVNSDLGDLSEPVAVLTGEASAWISFNDEYEVHGVEIDRISIIGLSAHQEYKIAEVNLRNPGTETISATIKRWAFKTTI